MVNVERECRKSTATKHNMNMKGKALLQQLGDNTQRKMGKALLNTLTDMERHKRSARHDAERWPHQGFNVCLVHEAGTQPTHIRPSTVGKHGINKNEHGETTLNNNGACDARQSVSTHSESNCRTTCTTTTWRDNRSDNHHRDW